MAGILVALQIQNWNEGRKLEQVRQELIEGLTQDFQRNLKRADESLEQVESDIRTIRMFLKSTLRDGKPINEEEVRSFMNASHLELSYRPLLAKYNSAVSTGSISLLQSPHLEELLLEFVETNSRFQKFFHLSIEDIILHSTPSLRLKIGSFSSISPDGMTPLPEQYPFSKEEFLKLLKDKEGFAYFENRWTLRLTRQQALTEIKQTAEKIFTALEGLE